ncbi:MAG TPA: aminotransferase, partial [Flavobacteriales bacterium]|nr:aminotransferase [Flavobacteriales bacterium]
IAKVWPLLSNDKPQSADIRKFETLGTRSFPAEMATGYSLDLHNLIGPARKQQRLHFLKSYWMDRVMDVPGIFFRTLNDPRYSCAIGTFGMEGKKATAIAEALHTKWKIHTVAIERAGIPGVEAPYNHVRVTPNVYTTTQELDRLVEAIRTMA